MAKPTSLAAQIAQQDAKAAASADKQDAELRLKPVPPGKVWVRLVRPYYDADNVMYPAGLALLDEAQAPKSAKRITPELPVAEPDADGEDNDND